MFVIRIIKWLKGYVIVNLKGENTAGFLNFCAKNSVAVWDVNNEKGVLIFSVSIKNYFLLRGLKRRFNAKIKLRHISAYGFPLKANLINKRKSVAVGFALCASVLIIMSQFVWGIEISGNKAVSKEEILRACNEMGVREGMPTASIEPYHMRDRLPLLVKNISWCSFNLEGSKLTVNISENRESDRTGKNSYSNLVATQDGIIRSMEITSGNKQTDIGRVVSKGDVLVSGAPNLNAQKFTYSEGKIFADVEKVISVLVPKKQTVAKKSNVYVTKRILEIFTLKIPLYLDTVHFYNATQERKSQLNLFGGTLPICVYEKRFNKVDLSEVTRNDDEMLNDAYAELISLIASMDITDIKILDIYTQDSSDKCTFTFKCKCIENIAEQRQINISVGN